MKYEVEALPSLQQIWQLNRARYLELGRAGGQSAPGPQDFLFVGLNEKNLLLYLRFQVSEFCVV